MNELEKKIEQRLSEYIGFDIKEIINEKSDAVHVFGGAIRDIIADKEIHDIDILCLFESMRKIIPVLERNGYYVHNSLTVKDIQSMYSEVHVVIEPITYIKVIDNEIRIIQLIRPGQSKMSGNTIHNYNEKNPAQTLKNYYYLLGQVDMSNCAVHYSYKFGLKESVYGAVQHCKLGIFEILETQMKTTRFEGRKQKLEKRGWINSNTNNKQKQKQLLRLKKLDNILDEEYEINYYMPPPGPDIKITDIKKDDLSDIDFLF